MHRSPLQAERDQNDANLHGQKLRYIWSDKNGQPLRQMDERHLNMAEIREQLNVTSVRMKIEKAQLLKMEQILRRNVAGLVKQAVLGWYKKLEEQNKTRRLPHRNTITYGRKVIEKAGEDPNIIENLANDRRKRRAFGRKRIKLLEEYERQQGHNHMAQRDEITRGIRESTKKATENTLKCGYCDKNFTHFTQEATLKIHMKKCSKTSPKNVPAAQKYVPKKGVCPRCDSWIALTNMSKHQTTDKCNTLSLLKNTNRTDIDAARQ